LAQKPHRSRAAGSSQQLRDNPARPRSRFVRQPRAHERNRRRFIPWRPELMPESLKTEWSRGFPGPNVKETDRSFARPLWTIQRPGSRSAGADECRHKTHECGPTFKAVEQAPNPPHGGGCLQLRVGVKTARCRPPAREPVRSAPSQPLPERPSGRCGTNTPRRRPRRRRSFRRSGANRSMTGPKRSSDRKG